MIEFEDVHLDIHTDDWFVWAEEGKSRVRCHVTNIYRQENFKGSTEEQWERRDGIVEALKPRWIEKIEAKEFEADGSVRISTKRP